MTRWIGTDTFDDKVTELTVTGPARLAVTFADGARFDVDMASVFARSKYLAPLQNPELFAQAKIIFAGSGIGWTEELDYGGDALRQLAEGQTDMTGSAFVLWMERHHLTDLDAGDALGLGRSTIQKYKALKKKAIPQAIKLACKAMDGNPPLLASRIKPRRRRGRPAKKSAA